VTGMRLEPSAEFPIVRLVFTHEQKIVQSVP
jgi:hypothetical protein